MGSFGCCFCKASISVWDGVVDIGGLKLCFGCYDVRSKRTHLPCHLCGASVHINPNPLVTSAVCPSCEQLGFRNLGEAWDAAKKRVPCDCCGRSGEIHHPTCWGQNLCHACYLKKGTPCTQMYPGDRGYPAFNVKPSKPAALLPFGTDRGCCVCNKGLASTSVSQFDLPSICTECEGPKWWDRMHVISDSIPDVPHVPFPRWQPVRCPQCSWHGPASKAVTWFADPKQYCPSCNIPVVKHEGAKS